MELKHVYSLNGRRGRLLLIELYGIETHRGGRGKTGRALLIELYGIETVDKPLGCPYARSFNRTIWN